MSSIAFSYRRRIAWGECDPARISYAPRTIDYAVEAVEAWREDVLERSRYVLDDQHIFSVAFVGVDCDYLRPLIASQVIQVRVWVASIERTRVTFVVVGEGENGVRYFQARLVGCLVEKNTLSPLPMPSGLRQRIESYRAQCGEADSVMRNGKGSGLWSPWMLAAGSGVDAIRRHVLPTSGTPFNRKLRVKSGDYDASGMIFPPRAFDYGVEVIGEWYEEVLGISWMELVCRRNQGAPWVSGSCAYLRPMVPGQWLTLAVWVTSLGGSSLQFAVIGFDDQGLACFEARLAACFIDQKGFKAMQIPEEFRLRIQSYQTACAVVEGGSLTRKDAVG